jgi:hypothetical protein
MKTINATDLQYAGSFAVDSGQAMVGDPCYLGEWKGMVDGEPFDHENHIGEYGYLGACGTTIKDSFGVLGNDEAVVFSTGYGDGHYPVYVQLNDEGRVVKVVIDFEGDVE